MAPEGRGPIAASRYLKTAQVFQSQCFFKRCLYPFSIGFRTRSQSREPSSLLESTYSMAIG